MRRQGCSGGNGAQYKTVSYWTEKIAMAETEKKKPFCYEYDRPALGTDCIILKRSQGRLWLLTITRKADPYKGFRAFPGGYFDMQDFTVEETAKRELKEEVGLEGIALTLFNVFSEPDRDPRERTVSVAFWGVAKETDEPKAGDDAADAQWLPVDELPEMAFDHNKMVAALLEMVQKNPDRFPQLQG